MRAALYSPPYGCIASPDSFLALAAVLKLSERYKLTGARPNAACALPGQHVQAFIPLIEALQFFVSQRAFLFEDPEHGVLLLRHVVYAVSSIVRRFRVRSARPCDLRGRSDGIRSSELRNYFVHIKTARVACCQRQGLAPVSFHHRNRLQILSRRRVPIRSQIGI
jgi:hypothetical protein